jgi:two-component system cell cycle response regulator
VQGKILIVDAIATNRIVLKVKLTSAFYQVVQASTMAEAAKLAREHVPQLIISALSLPDGRAGELCTLLRRTPMTEHIPIMAIGCRPNADTRIATLETGVQDVLLKPVDDMLLLGRVRSLIRAHNAAAEWQMREDTSRALGLAEQPNEFEPLEHCILVSDDPRQTHGWATRLRALMSAKICSATAKDAMGAFHQGTIPDVFVLVLPQDHALGSAALNLISTLRANASTRHVGLLVVQTAHNPILATNALDLGADDLMTDGFEAVEMALRLKALSRRKRRGEKMRATVRTGLEAAIVDPLTGLHNRRYAMPHLSRITDHSISTGRPFAVMVADLDHFKRVNDLYGHASGDMVLTEVARRLRHCMRGVDMVARIGGEEFMVVMPNTALADAQLAAVRICNDISQTPFDVPGHTAPIEITISIGIAIGGLKDSGDQTNADNDKSLLDRADKALYCAKMHGRNQVTLSRPAA